MKGGSGDSLSNRIDRNFEYTRLTYIITNYKPQRKLFLSFHFYGKFY